MTKNAINQILNLEDGWNQIVIFLGSADLEIANYGNFRKNKKNDKLQKLEKSS